MKANDYRECFVGSSQTALDMVDEIRARMESKQWVPDALNPCPVCAAPARVSERDNGQVDIVCSRWGCREVIGKHRHEAVELWNKPRGW
jgi:hypothetical protein